MHTKAINFTARLFKKFLKRKIGSAIILPPSWGGSLGDEAVISSVSGRLKKIGVHKVVLLGWNTANPWVHLKQIDNYFTLKKFMDIPFSDVIRTAILFCKFENFYILGTDVIDGVYSFEKPNAMLDLAQLAHDSGMNVILSGISISKNPDKRLIHKIGTLNESIKICVRDPVSLERLSGYINRKMVLTSDPAFMLIPDFSTAFVQKFMAWVKTESVQSKILVGINFNKHLLKNRFQQGCEFFSESLKRTYSAFNGALRFVMIPHDFRESIGDLGVCSDLYYSLIHTYQESSFLVDQKCSAAEIKAILSALDFVVSGRMHIAIAALGSKIPVCCLTYQDKFEGLFDHFQVGDLVFNPENLFEGRRFSDFLINAIDNRDSIREKIAKRHGHVMALSEENIL